MKTGQSLKKFALIAGLSLLFPMQAVWALAVDSQDPITYTWVGQCDPLAVDENGNPAPGSCTGDATAKIVFNSYDIVSGTNLFTPLSVSSFTYYDNDPLFTQAFGDQPVTWFFDTIDPTLQGQLLLDGTQSDFKLSFATTNSADESMLVSFATLANGMWSFTADVAGQQTIAGSGTNQVPAPATITLFVLGLFVLIGFSARPRKLQLAFN